jgi:hypothetical protein
MEPGHHIDALGCNMHAHEDIYLPKNMQSALNTPCLLILYSYTLLLCSFAQQDWEIMYSLDVQPRAHDVVYWSDQPSQNNSLADQYGGRTWSSGDADAMELLRYREHAHP